MKTRLTKLNIAQLVKMIYFLCFFLTLTAVVVHAQGSAPPDPGTDPSAPIDGGLSLLIAAGVGYGAKKLREKKKQQEEEANK